MKQSILLGSEISEFMREETLSTIFRETAKKRKREIALIYHQRSITYEELDEWSDAIAGFLVTKKIGNGIPVGVWLPRGLELHATILGIIKAGACYVPIDYEVPKDRVNTILLEVGAIGCFTDKQETLLCTTYNPIPQNTAFDKNTLPKQLSPDDWAYVLYTSGSTGKPKGIPISQRQICHLVRAEQNLFQIKPEDKVYQGFSVSFDMWCEETWISYLAGASIWISDTLTAKSIDELSTVLEREHITIFHAVPSLLAAMQRDVPSVRLVNSGGEACTPKALKKWANSKRLFYNSYGPTETTVSALIAELNVNDVISVGNVLANYSVAVVDQYLNPVEVGDEGELVISGIGVAEGYIKLPELTREKFVSKPISLEKLYGKTVYRTGDLAVINDKGNIEFKGRLDDQVKFHGYRIELGEIESKLSLISGIKSVASAIKKDLNGNEFLVAFLQVENRVTFEESAIKAALAKTLPVYMIPSRFVIIDEIPRLSSGKINRKGLPDIEFKNADKAATKKNKYQSGITVSEKVETILNELFPDKTISLKEDFFDQLGGDSFSSALFVSEMRDTGITNASFKDVYIHRPLNTLVNFWEEGFKKSEEKSKTNIKQKEKFNTTKTSNYVFCSIAQTLSLLFIFALFAMQIFLPYLGYSYVFSFSKSHLEGIIIAFSLFCVIPFFLSFLAITLKWIVIGKMKEGDYPIWGTYYFKWWFVKHLQKLVSIQYVSDTPLYPLYLRAMGLKIGNDAQLSTLNIGAEDLVTMGDDVSISSNVVLDNAYLENGWLKLRKIELGNHAYIGSNAVIGPDTKMEDWSELQDLSALLSSQIICKNEVWKGSPAKKINTKKPDDFIQPLTVSFFTKTLYGLIFTIMPIIFPLATIIPILPTIVILNEQNHNVSEKDFFYLLKITPLLAIVYVVIFLIQTIVCSRVLNYKIKPGVYKIYSFLYLRKWLSDQFMGLSLTILHPIYATIYVSSMFRAFGAKIGSKTEISTASGITHPLLEIGDGGFVADAVTLGESDVRGLRFTLKKTIIKSMSFVGNGAVIPQGYELNGNMLIGVLSTPPSEEQQKLSSAKDWFGSPPIALPRRQQNEIFPESLTINPSLKKRISRGFIEFLRIIIPPTVITLSSIIFISYSHNMIVKQSVLEILLLLPLYYLALVGLPCFVFTLLLKWLFIGRYKPQQFPMWTFNVWKSEAVTTTYESIAVPFLLEFLTGTFWLPVALRMMGVKIGKRVCMNTTDITEYDVVSIGDDTSLNEDCGPQTHLFEDRIMKIGNVSIGKRCTIGTRTIILYNSNIEDDATILPLSLVMKGETISGNKNWGGSPIRLME